MTPPASTLEESLPQGETVNSLRDLFGHLQRWQEETRTAISDLNARFDEFLGHSPPTESSSVSPSRFADVATRHQEYEKSVTQLREIVQQYIPAGANVLVISKGDDALLRMEGRFAQHFPQGADGRYAGFHPIDSAAALAELERLASKGAEFLVIPATSLWWLDHYHEFAEHLSETFIFRDEAIGVICALQRRKVSNFHTTPDRAGDHFYTQLRAVVGHLLPPHSRLLVISKGDAELVNFEGLNAGHFPQAPNGAYAGFHPADGAAAIRHLAELEAEYLLIPQPSGWWLDEYPDFRAYLTDHARLIFRQHTLGTLYALAYVQA